MMKNTDPTAPLKELATAQLTPALTPAAARMALGGISRATEHRWQKAGILTAVYIGKSKLYRAEDIRELLEKGAA